MKCEYCGKEFINKSIRHPFRRFCSYKCSHTKWVIDNIEKNRDYKRKYRNKVRDLPITKEKRRKQWKIWYKKNKERRKEMKRGWNKKYYLKNREFLLNKTKEYYQKNKEKRNEYILNKLKTDKNFRIAWRIRNRVRRTLLLYIKTNQVYARKYGVDYKGIIEHLKPFPKDISKFHVDHIKPLCSFDLTDPEQIKIAFAPENHQWLTVQENLRKGSK